MGSDYSGNVNPRRRTYTFLTAIILLTLCSGSAGPLLYLLLRPEDHV